MRGDGYFLSNIVVYFCTVFGIFIYRCHYFHISFDITDSCGPGSDLS